MSVLKISYKVWWTDESASILASSSRSVDLENAAYLAKIYDHFLPSAVQLAVQRAALVPPFALSVTIISHSPLITALRWLCPDILISIIRFIWTAPSRCSDIMQCYFLPYSIQDYLYRAFYDTIIVKQLYRKLSLFNRFIYCRNLIHLTYIQIIIIIIIIIICL